jgi:hypothetical protein
MIIAVAEMIGQHGGKRKNAGRKPDKYPTQLLKIKCTRAELEQILQLSTRERAEAMLKSDKCHSLT